MTSKTVLMLGAVLVAATAGCSVTPDYPNEEFGSSVRQMVQQQTYDPAAAANPAEGIQGPLQGEKAASAMDGYRKGRGPASESDAAAKLNASISGTATQ